MEHFTPRREMERLLFEANAKKQQAIEDEVARIIEARSRHGVVSFGEKQAIRRAVVAEHELKKMEARPAPKPAEGQIQSRKNKMENKLPFHKRKY